MSSTLFGRLVAPHAVKERPGFAWSGNEQAPQRVRPSWPRSTAARRNVTPKRRVRRAAAGTATLPKQAAPPTGRAARARRHGARRHPGEAARGGTQSQRQREDLVEALGLQLLRHDLRSSGKKSVDHSCDRRGPIKILGAGRIRTLRVTPARGLGDDCQLNLARSALE